MQGGPFTPGPFFFGRLGSWASPLHVIPANGMEGRYYRCTIDLSGNAASAAAAPGYRFLYLSAAYIHLGGIQGTSPSKVSPTVFVSPYISHPRTMHVAWAVPLDTIEYGDAGILNHGIEPANDLRAYTLQFDLMQTDATDAGALFLENVLVEKAPRPADAVPAREWGRGGSAFNAPGGWTISWLSPEGFSVAKASVSTSSLTLSLGDRADEGFRSLVPASAAGLPPLAAGKMLRTSYVVSSSDPAKTPPIRFLTLGTMANSMGPLYWGDQLTYTAIRANSTPAQSPAGIPGSFKAATGSKLEFYALCQYAGEGSEQVILTPQADIIQAYGPAQPPDGWQQQSATVTISNIKMEMLGE